MVFTSAFRRVANAVSPGIADGRLFYHGTRNKALIEGACFHPLSHFGSQAAATARLKQSAAEETGAVIAVRLTLKNPLILEDLGGGHGLATWRLMLERNPVLVEFRLSVMSSTGAAARCRRKSR